MPIITFIVSVEADLEGEFATTEEVQREILAAMEEVIAKRGLSLNDSSMEVED
jgi:hypothetical protein